MISLPYCWQYELLANIALSYPCSLFGAGQAVLRPVACDPVPGAGGKGQGAEMLREAWRRLSALAELVFRNP